MKDTLTILHPGVEGGNSAMPAAMPATMPAAPGARTREPGTVPRLAPRLTSFQGARIALLDNTKVNAREFLEAVGRRLQRAHGAAEVRTWRKRHAGETGAAAIAELVKWKPHLALTALGD